MTRSIDLSTEVVTGHEEVLVGSELPSQTVIDATGGLIMPEAVEAPVTDQQMQVPPEMSAEAAELFAQLSTIKAGIREFEESYYSQQRQPYFFDPHYARALEQADPIVRKLAALGYRNVSPLR